MASKGLDGASAQCICSYVTQGKKICVFKEDLTKHHVDVIVNFAERDLQLTEGLAEAIAREGGKEFQSECDAFIRDNGSPLLPGRAIVTSSGKLPCDRITHVVAGPKWNVTADNTRKDGKKTKQESYLRYGLLNSLDSAKELRSIAIPGINSVDPAFPRDLCAKVILDAVLHFCKENPTCNLSEIHLTDNDDSTVMEFLEEMRRRFAQKDTFVDLELMRLREEIERLEKEKENIGNRCNELLIEKKSLEEHTEAMTNEIEILLLEQGDREEQFKIELESERNAKEEAEQSAADLQTTLTARENNLQDLEKSLFVAQRELSECQGKDNVELMRLRNEIETFKLKQRERINQVKELETSLSTAEQALSKCLSEGDLREKNERFELEQRSRERKVHFESELEKERNAKKDSEQQTAKLQTTLTDKEHKVKKLEKSLSTAQWALRICLRSEGDLEQSRLRKEIEGFKLEQREREGHFESELEKERNAKEVSEQHAANLQTTLTAKENELQTMVTTTERTSSTYLEEIRRLRSNIDRLKEEKGNIGNRCSEILIEKERLEEEVEAKTNEIERTQQHAANLQTTLTATENQVQELQTNLSTVQRALNEGQQNAKEVSEQHAANLQTMLIAKENELQTMVTTTEWSLSTYLEEIRLLRSNIDRLKEEKGNIENMCSELLNEQERLGEEVEAKTNEIERTQQHAANLQTTLTATENQVQELQTNLSTVQRALNEGQQNETRDWVLSRDEIHLDDEVVGKGAWGTVYQGKFRGCKVAVKIIHELILSPHNRRLFEREMMIASTCRHPCLLQFIGATNDDGNPLFVTELMESSLRAQLEKRALSEADVKAISLDVAQALNYLHLKKPSPIIHRDISSANVLLWRQGEQWRGKVSDYGTANFMSQSMTAGPGAMIYCAPEAVTQNQTIKMDVYSFGVLLCEMCIGEQPEPQNRERQVNKVKDRMLQNIIRRCIKPRPEKRPSMEEIINELEVPTTLSRWPWNKKK